jgi:hypothetical protein
MEKIGQLSGQVEGKSSVDGVAELNNETQKERPIR